MPFGLDISYGHGSRILKESLSGRAGEVDIEAMVSLREKVRKDWVDANT